MKSGAEYLAAHPGWRTKKKERKQRNATWCERRVTIVVSDAYHTIHMLSLLAKVRLLKPMTAGGVPVIEGPVDAITEKAQAKMPERFKGMDIVGVLCAAWDMTNKGTIVWLTPTKKVEVEPGADRI